jgi:hypothetical protein
MRMLVPIGIHLRLDLSRGYELRVMKRQDFPHEGVVARTFDRVVTQSFPIPKVSVGIRLGIFPARLCHSLHFIFQTRLNFSNRACTV